MQVSHSGEISPQEPVSPVGTDLEDANSVVTPASWEPEALLRLTLRGAATEKVLKRREELNQFSILFTMEWCRSNKRDLGWRSSKMFAL